MRAKVSVNTEGWTADDQKDEGDTNCRRCCSRQFRCSSWCLEHHRPYLFAVSQWRGSRMAYVVYRIVVALYFMVWLVLSGTGQLRGTIHWFVYETNWAFLLLTLRFIVQAWVATHFYIYNHMNDKGGPSEMNFQLKTEWVLYNISSAGAIITTIIFWFALYLPDPDSYPIDAINIHTHSVNTFIVVLDIGIAGIPLRILHFYHSTIFILLYLIFNLLYTLAGGTDEVGNHYIYKSLDWHGDPEKAVLWAVGVTVGMVAIWLLLVFWFWSTRAICQWLCPGKDVTNSKKGVKAKCMGQWHNQQQRSGCKLPPMHSQAHPVMGYSYDGPYVTTLRV